MKKHTLINFRDGARRAILVMVLLLAAQAGFSQVPLGSLSTFAMFTGVGALGNTGASTAITGDIGTNAGAITGYSSANVSGVIYAPGTKTAQGATDVQAAYQYLLGMATTISPAIAPAMSGVTLSPGVYGFGGAASIGGIVTLDAKNVAGATFVFKINGALTSGASSQIVLINGADANNVFWQVNGAASFATQSIIVGTIVAVNAVSLGDGASLNGRALSTTGAISTYNNRMNIPVVVAAPAPTPTPTPTPTPSPTTTNTALAFNGLTQYVQGSNAQLPLGNTARTIEAWINPVKGYANGVIFNYGTASTNQLSGITMNGGYLNYSGGTNDLRGNIKLTVGVWNHVAASYNGTSLSLYVNGKLDVTKNMNAFNTTGSTWRIAQLSAPTSGGFMTGSVDEVRVWNMARTGTDILNNKGTSITGTVTNLIANYRFNEGTGSTLGDASPSASTGTLYNNPAWTTTAAPVSNATTAARLNLQADVAAKLVLTADDVVLFPNPSNARFTVLVPAVAETSQFEAELLNNMGQVVRKLSADLPESGVSLGVETAGLAGGFYTLRLHAGSTTINKRVVLQ